MTHMMKICSCGSKDHTEINDTQKMELKYICMRCKSISTIDYGRVVVDWMNIPKVRLDDDREKAAELENKNERLRL